MLCVFAFALLVYVTPADWTAYSGHKIFPNESQKSNILLVIWRIFVFAFLILFFDESGFESFPALDKGLSFNAPPTRILLIATHEYVAQVKHIEELRSL